MINETKGRIVCGGVVAPQDRYVAPTIVAGKICVINGIEFAFEFLFFEHVDVTEDDSLMLEEIFGPILPVKVVESVDEVSKCFFLVFVFPSLKVKLQAIQVMHRVHLKPLALYIFARNQSVIDRLACVTREFFL
jgi:hypothetical protein